MPMSDETTIEALGDHQFVLHLKDPEGGAVDVRVYASPDVLGRLGAASTDAESRVVEATAAHLLARQQADDLPSYLELDDVVAAYDEYLADLEDRLGRGALHGDQAHRA